MMLLFKKNQAARSSQSTEKPPEDPASNSLHGEIVHHHQSCPADPSTQFQGLKTRGGAEQHERGSTPESILSQSVKALTDRRAMDKSCTRELSGYHTLEQETFYFAGHNISIRESMDTFGALVWPGAIALCQFLENNQQQVKLMDKAVLEIGAGTGLLSVVASLLGARVTATDLPDILPNLSFNLQRNTKGRSRYTPQVAALSWGQDLQRDFPLPSNRFDYLLAADVVYPHDRLEDLLKTMHYFCRPGSGTTLLWANKIRFESDVSFTECFQKRFNAKLLAQLPQQEVWIYSATAKE